MMVESRITVVLFSAIVTALLGTFRYLVTFSSSTSSLIKQQEMGNLAVRVRSMSSVEIQKNESGILSEKNTATRPLESMSVSEQKDQPKLPLCTPAQIEDGSWIPKLLSFQDLPYNTSYKTEFCGSVGYESQEKLRSNNKQQKEPVIQSYEWRPQSNACEFRSTFDKSEFCRLVHNETLLIMGDSLTEEFHRSLSNLLGGSDEKSACSHQPVCGGTAHVTFRRVDFLDPDDKVKWELQKRFPKYVMLNTGAHYTPDHVFADTIQKTIAQVRIWQDRCREHGKECQLFWRTSVPGHPNCMNYQEPIKPEHSARMESMIAKDRNGANEQDFQLGRDWYWDRFQHQNILARSLFANASSSNNNLLDYAILDAYKINLLRPDGHVSDQDCLHSCLGSKIDVYAHIMIHYMKVHQQQQLQTSTT